MKDVSRAGSMVQKTIVCVLRGGSSRLDYLCPSKPRGPLPSAPAGPQQSPPQTIAQQAQAAAQPQPVTYQGPFHIELPHSHNPLAPYMPSTVPELNLQNSQRLYDLIRDGKLRISLQDAIALALENNLTLASFRYNFPIAQADLLRTKAGGIRQRRQHQRHPDHAERLWRLRGRRWLREPSSATAGAGGIVTSTLGAGAAVPSFDPFLIFSGFVQHTVTPEPNVSQVGTRTL